MSKIHNHRHPRGLEWMILKKIPQVILAGIFIPLFMAIISRAYPIAGSAAEIARHQLGIDVFSISLFFMVASAAFTVTVSCVIFVLMKGKGTVYAADTYTLKDYYQPRARHKRDK
jgi:hypothetical protein